MQISYFHSVRFGNTFHEIDPSTPYLLCENSFPRISLSPLGNAIKLSGRTFLAPHRGSCPEGLCKRTGFLGVKRRENQVRRHTASMPLLPSALPPKGEARRYVANDFLNLIALPRQGNTDSIVVRFNQRFPRAHCPQKQKPPGARSLSHRAADSISLSHPAWQQASLSDRSAWRYVHSYLWKVPSSCLLRRYSQSWQ